MADVRRRRAGHRVRRRRDLAVRPEARAPDRVDESVELCDTVYVSGGRRGLDVEIAPADLVEVTGAIVADRSPPLSRSVGREPDDARGPRRRRPSRLIPNAGDRLEVVENSSSSPATPGRSASSNSSTLTKSTAAALSASRTTSLKHVVVAEVAVLERPRRGSRRRGRSRSCRRRVGVEDPSAPAAVPSRSLSSTFSISSGSPLIFTATGTSEPSGESKNASGSKSEPSDQRGRVAGQRLGVVGQVEPGSSPDLVPAARRPYSPGGRARTGRRGRRTSRRRSRRRAPRRCRRAAPTTVGAGVVARGQPLAGRRRRRRPLELDGAVVEADGGRHPLKSWSLSFIVSSSRHAGRRSGAPSVDVGRAVARRLASSRREAVGRAGRTGRRAVVGVVGEVVAGRRAGVHRHDAGVAGLVGPVLEVLVVGQRALGCVGGDDLVGDRRRSRRSTAQSPSIAQRRRRRRRRSPRSSARPSSAASASLTWTTKTGPGSSPPVSTAATAARSPSHGSMSSA